MQVRFLITEDCNANSVVSNQNMVQSGSKILEMDPRFYECQRISSDQNASEINPDALKEPTSDFAVSCNGSSNQSCDDSSVHKIKPSPKKRSLSTSDDFADASSKMTLPKSKTTPSTRQYTRSLTRGKSSEDVTNTDTSSHLFKKPGKKYNLKFSRRRASTAARKSSKNAARIVSPKQDSIPEEEAVSNNGCEEQIEEPEVSVPHSLDLPSTPVPNLDDDESHDGLKVIHEDLSQSHLIPDMPPAIPLYPAHKTFIAHSETESSKWSNAVKEENVLSMKEENVLSMSPSQANVQQIWK